MILRNLKAKIILITLSIYLVIGLATLVAFQSAARTIIQSFALRFASKETLLEKNKISSIIDREVVLAQKMATDTTLIRWAVNQQDAELQTHALAELESYRKLFRDKSVFIALAESNNYYVYNRAKGHERIEVHRLQAGDADDRWYFAGMQAIDNYELNLDYNPSLNATKVWINAVLTGAQGERLGLCGSGIDITDFLNEIVTTSEDGLSNIIIDQAGRIQAHEDRAIVARNATVRDPAQKTTIFNLIDEPRAQAQLQAALATLSAGKSPVEAFSLRFGGKDYLVAISHLQEVGWFNLTLVDVSRVISMRAFLPILLGMALALLLMIVALALFMNRIVLAPLGKLTIAASEVAHGRYDRIAISASSDDEIGRLTSAFNAMTATILDHIDNLEGKVCQRTTELSTANRLLEESKGRILESIAYARMIQASILPDSATLQQTLGEHLLVYRPKEMVGGDFYYLRDHGDRFLLAVIDCTGHGIPGALMTMTVNAILNHVVEEQKVASPAQILVELDRRLLQALNLQEVDAGLDMALCLVEPASGQLQFAGAGLSLYILSSDDIREIKGDHARVGYRNLRRKLRYNDQQIVVAPGDTCYLTSDGLLDERGGEQGFGFGSRRFKEMLVAHATLPLQEQATRFEEIISAYRGSYPQRDDVTLIGFRVSDLCGRQSLQKRM